MPILLLLSPLSRAPPPPAEEIKKEMNFSDKNIAETLKWKDSDRLEWTIDRTPSCQQAGTDVATGRQDHHLWASGAS